MPSTPPAPALSAATLPQQIIALDCSGDLLEKAQIWVEQARTLPGFTLFDSGQPTHERGHYDIFTAAPLFSLRYQDGQLLREDFQQQNSQSTALNGNELVQYLNRELQEQQQLKNSLTDKKGISLPFYGGFAGYFSYDIGRVWEALPEQASDDIQLPLMDLGFYPWSCVVDYHQNKAWLSFLPQCPQPLRDQVIALFGTSSSQLENKNIDEKFNTINKLEPEVNLNYYSSSLAKIQDYILTGDCYQVNYAQRFTGTFQGSPWKAYKGLRQAIQAPFSSFLRPAPAITANKSDNNESKVSILSFSPERFLEIRGSNVTTQPIKGTVPRHHDPKQDQELAQSLVDSPKNQAENLMIVDLLRNDLGKCCEFGTVKTEKLFELQSFSNVHHLVSTISGTLKPGYSPFDLLQATLPGGSITGAPKIRAMEIIEELEPSRRSIYCGIIAYIDISGDMDSNIAIRTALCEGERIHCWGGGGIVADSDSQQEYQESLDKIAPILETLNSSKL